MWGHRRSLGEKESQYRFTPTRVGTSVSRRHHSIKEPVHPHACGDIRQPQRPSLRAGGSPPRVWGHQPDRPGSYGRLRFTPTCVGTSRVFRWCLVLGSVHPHACGDIVLPVDREVISSGSPPRAWGQLKVGAGHNGLQRFTPTRVGTTLPHRCIENRYPVHPHACGDNDGSPGRGIPTDGSPPRVWGHLILAQSGVTQQRFTPTRVGTSSNVVIGGICSSVHPHACGDIAAGDICARTTSGSPPRVWGHRCCPIPCCLHSVHPHACGDIQKHVYTYFYPSGSPPRVWGHPRSHLDGGGCHRFTPTRVGTSCRRRRSGLPAAVHPHACGDILLTIRLGRRRAGSPPRVWGHRR